MRLYLDTEFNGFGGDLISIALVVAPEGHSWYRACECFSPIDPWVKKNVIPVIGSKTLLPNELKGEFHEFIRGFKNPEIICDWHADAEHFCRLLQGFDYGSSLDFECTITILKTPPGQPVSKAPHNALSDAYALMEWNEKRLSA